MLLMIALLCFLWPIVHPVPAPIGGDVLESNLPAFSPGHVLGTDRNGNDIWSRLLHGGRASLSIALLVNLLGLVIGGLIGAVSAQSRGVMDSVTMRLIDVVIAFPSLVLVLAIAQALGTGYRATIVALAFFSVPAFARVARAATLRLREHPFMLAAALSGTRRGAILIRHILPNILPQLVAFALLGLGVVVIIEGALGFLGLGVPAPMPSWGNMIAQGQESLSMRPSLVLLPSAMLFLTVLSCNILGEALREHWGSR
jgi:peptide/nickel transport system permease protein